MADAVTTRADLIGAVFVLALFLFAAVGCAEAVPLGVFCAASDGALRFFAGFGIIIVAVAVIVAGGLFGVVDGLLPLFGCCLLRWCAVVFISFVIIIAVIIIVIVVKGYVVKRFGH